MTNISERFPLHVGIVVLSAEQLTAVYALLGGASSVAIASAAPAAAPVRVNSLPAAEGAPAAEEASGEVELDSDGHPWSADLHAGTKGKTREGLWRMKPGVSRPAPVEGFPKADEGNGGTGTKSDGPAPAAGEAAPTADAGPATADEEEDEFAAFASDAKPADVPARSWTDADLSSLCNQAAQALGGPDKVRSAIADFLPEGATNHSRNIPADKREEFAQKLEKVAGIEFAG